MNGEWILVAEDDERDADLILRALRLTPGERRMATPGSGIRNSNFGIHVARDGSEALDCLYHRNGFQSLNGRNPAAVVLDLKMPKVNGIEVLRRVKTDAKLRLIPVVIFSSSREEADLASCYQAGANAYVVKPLNFKEFTASVKEIRAFWLVVNEPPPGK